MVMTPEDARRLVKNRIDRENRARLALDKKELERLDFVEEAVAAYLSESDFVEYVTDTIDAAIKEAVNSKSELYIGFHSCNGSGDKIGFGEAEYHLNRRRSGYLCIFDVSACEIAEDMSEEYELERVFSETVRKLYEDMGWEVRAVDPPLANDSESWEFRAFIRLDADPRSDVWKMCVTGFQLVVE